MRAAYRSDRFSAPIIAHTKGVKHRTSGHKMRYPRTHTSRIQRVIVTPLELVTEIALFVLLSCLAAGRLPDHLTSWGSAMPHPNNAGSSPFEISGSAASPHEIAETQRPHRIYGHSLVPGGIHSLNDLAWLRRDDPLLAENYKSFDLSKARFIVLDHDVVAYVSYRQADRMYWESHPTVIEKRELVITDGSNFIRARCGNLISYIPGLPTSPDEPTDIDVPAFPSSGEPPQVPGTNQPLPFVPVAEPAAPPTPSPAPGMSSAPMNPEPVSVFPCCFTGGGVPPAGPQTGAPPSEFNADEFSTLTLPFLGRLPEELVTLVAGIVLVVAFCFFVGRS